MAHKTLVGGTAYDTKGGRCLVNGTGYSIKKGRTLVGGTGYDIGFDPTIIALTITGTGDSSRGYVTIGGNKYYSATSNIEVIAGDTITFGVYGYSDFYSGKVTIDGSTVITAASDGTKTYAWTVPQGISAVTVAFTKGGMNSYTITVTTS